MKPETLAALEAVLFIHGEPISKKKIGKVLGLAEEDIAAAISALEEKLRGENRGLTLLSDGDKVQLITKPEFHKILENFVKSELSEDLTPASVETMAIIAYFGPISRARIEYQRGVNSVFILRNLMLRGLVERFPDPEHAQSFLYRPTFEFWRHIGVNRKEDLPEYQKFKDLLDRFEAQEI
jgi:segregation and condensation protein B